jgi:rhodanese-related sulfurtransferase
MNFYPAKEIIPGLWVGSSADSRNRVFLREKDIGLVVNASKTIPFTSRHILGYRVAVDDHPSENEAMVEYFPIACRLIDETLKSDKSVLVHCYAGVQRSCAIAACYLMYKNQNLTASDAIRRIKEKKPEAFEPRPTFWSALKEYRATH